MPAFSAVLLASAAGPSSAAVPIADWAARRAAERRSPRPSRRGRASFPPVGRARPRRARDRDRASAAGGCARSPKAPTPGALRVNVMVSAGERFHVDVLDLYAAQARAGFLDAAATRAARHRGPAASRARCRALAIEEAQAAPRSPRRRQAPGRRWAPPSGRPPCELLSDPTSSTASAEAFGVLGLVGEAEAALSCWLVCTEPALRAPARRGHPVIVSGRQVDPC